MSAAAAFSFTPNSATAPIRIDSGRLRGAYRVKVALDQTISSSAVRLYIVLDDKAGPGGKCHWGQKALGKELDVSRQRINEWVQELRGAGHLRVGKSKAHRTNEMVMGWVAASVENQQDAAPVENQQDAQPMCPENRTSPVRKTGHRERAYPYTEPEKEPVVVVSDRCLTKDDDDGATRFTQEPQEKRAPIAEFHAGLITGWIDAGKSVPSVTQSDRAYERIGDGNHFLEWMRRFRKFRKCGPGALSCLVDEYRSYVNVAHMPPPPPEPLCNLCNEPFHDEGSINGSHRVCYYAAIWPTK